MKMCIKVKGFSFVAPFYLVMPFFDTFAHFNRVFLPFLPNLIHGLSKGKKEGIRI